MSRTFGIAALTIAVTIASGTEFAQAGGYGNGGFGNKGSYNNSQPMTQWGGYGGGAPQASWPPPNGNTGVTGIPPYNVPQYPYPSGNCYPNGGNCYPKGNCYPNGNCYPMPNNYPMPYPSGNWTPYPSSSCQIPQYPSCHGSNYGCKPKSCGSNHHGSSHH